MMGGNKREFMARASGGHVNPEHPDEAQDEGLIRKELRKAKIEPSTRKAGGNVNGHQSAERPDRKARGGVNEVANGFRERGIGIPSTRSAMSAGAGMGAGKFANGGSMNGIAHVDRRYKAEGIKQPHGPEKRADGGETGKKSKKHGVGNVTIVINTEGDQMAQQVQKQQAAQQGMQQGVQIGARAAAQKLAGAGAGGPPPPGAMPPGAGGPPPGAMPPGAGGPPMGGAPGGMPPRPGMTGPPPGAGPGQPPMVMPRKDGGGIRMRERAHERRVGGGV